MGDLYRREVANLSGRTALAGLGEEAWQAGSSSIVLLYFKRGQYSVMGGGNTAELAAVRSVLQDLDTAIQSRGGRP